MNLTGIRLLGRVCGLFFALILLAVPAAGARGGPQPDLSFVLAVRAIDQPVEQQSPNFYLNGCVNYASPVPCDPSQWVNNPTGCIWDVDDVGSYITVGAPTGAMLAAGAATTLPECVVADGFNSWGFDPHPVQVQLDAPKAGLVVTATSDQGQVVTSATTATGNGYRTLLCTADMTPGPYPTVAGSNGGVGIVSRWRITVTNPTNSAIRSITGEVVVGNSFAAAAATTCPG